MIFSLDFYLLIKELVVYPLEFVNFVHFLEKNDLFIYKILFSYNMPGTINKKLNKPNFSYSWYE